MGKLPSACVGNMPLAFGGPLRRSRKSQDVVDGVCGTSGRANTASNIVRPGGMDDSNSIELFGSQLSLVKNRMLVGGANLSIAIRVP